MASLGSKSELRTCQLVEIKLIPDECDYRQPGCSISTPFCCFPLKCDGLVKSRKSPRIVIPVKTGIQRFQCVTKHWTPVFTGVTTFYEAVKCCILGNEPKSKRKASAHDMNGKVSVRILHLSNPVSRIQGPASTLQPVINRADLDQL